MGLTNKKFKWLILPIETKVRELDGKLLLAAVAASRGWGVILGHKDPLAKFTRDLKGVVIEKDGNTGKDRINQYLNTGKKVCALDEEGLVYLNKHEYYRRRLDPEILVRLNSFFLWGGVQYNDVSEYLPEIEPRLSMVGNPRFDLLRSELRDYYLGESMDIKRRNGPFILINTNFDDSNHFLGVDGLMELRRNLGILQNQEQEETELAFIKFQSEIEKSFQEIIPELVSNFPSHTIIIRPHPSENHQRWDSIAKKHKNVKVIHKGDANPWIRAADVSIHNSCMTGIQCYLLNKPVISYMPIQSEEFDYFLPNALSTIVSNPDEMKSTIIGLMQQKESISNQPNQKKNIAEEYITATTGRFASDRIVDSLDMLEVQPMEWNPYLMNTKSNYQPARKLNNVISDLILLKNTFRMTKKQRYQKLYSQQKFPGIRFSEIEERLSRLNSISSRFKSIQAIELDQNIFCIFSM